MSFNLSANVMKTEFALKNSSMRTKVYALSSAVRLSSAGNLSHDNKIGTIRKHTAEYESIGFLRDPPHLIYRLVLSINTVKINRFANESSREQSAAALNVVNAPLIYYASLYSRLFLARFIRVIYHRDLFPGTQRETVAAIAFLREGAVHNGFR